MSAEGAALHRLPPTVARFRIWTEPTSAPLSALRALRAAIDAQGTTVVYTSFDGLHIFRTAQNQDTLVLRNDPSCSDCFAISAPSISADGK